MTQISRQPLFAAALFAGLLGAMSACSDEPAPTPSGGGGNPNGGDQVTNADENALVLVMREVEVSWLRAVEASAWLESGSLEPEQEAEKLQAIVAAAEEIARLEKDPRFAAPTPPLGQVFDSMGKGLVDGMQAWASAAESGDPNAIRRARSMVSASCQSCHRSMRDHDPAQLAKGMRRWETLHERMRGGMVRLHGSGADHGAYGLLAVSAKELEAMAQSGALAASPGAPPSHEAQRKVAAEEAANALVGAAEDHDLEQSLRSIGAVGLSCVSCHEARDVRLTNK